jgi:hypothetical protein
VGDRFRRVFRLFFWPKAHKAAHMVSGDLSTTMARVAAKASIWRHRADRSSAACKAASRSANSASL